MLDKSNSTFPNHIDPTPSPINPTHIPNSIVSCDDIITLSTTDPQIPHLDSHTFPSSRVSSRVRIKSSHLKYYICASFQDRPNQSSSCTPYTISSFLPYSKLYPLQCHFGLFVSSNCEPKSYTEASQFECWNQAMKVELEALDKTGTWELVDLPTNVKPIGCQWVYKVKQRADGNI